MFGKDRSTYISRDVFSDDEDMEADATILEREEKMRLDLIGNHITINILMSF